MGRGAHTHYHTPSGTWFSIELCKNCGNVVQAPNAVNVSTQEYHRALEGHVILRDSLPPEQYYSEELGCCACEDCM